MKIKVIAEFEYEPILEHYPEPILASVLETDGEEPALIMQMAISDYYGGTSDGSLTFRIEGTE